MGERVGLDVGVRVGQGVAVGCTVAVGATVGGEGPSGGDRSIVTREQAREIKMSVASGAGV